MLELILVRHGETIWSRTQQHTFRGRFDIPLNDLGVKQAKAVGMLLRDKEIYQIYSSPLIRAVDTANEIARFHGLEVQIHDGFIDLDFGDWQGKLHEDVKKQYLFIADYPCGCLLIRYCRRPGQTYFADHGAA